MYVKWQNRQTKKAKPQNDSSINPYIFIVNIRQLREQSDDYFNTRSAMADANWRCDFKIVIITAV